MLAERGASWMTWKAEPLPEVSKRLKSSGVRSAVVEPCVKPPEAGDLLDVSRRHAAAFEAVYKPLPRWDELLASSPAEDPENC